MQKHRAKIGVHRKALNFLITRDPVEAENLKRKAEDGALLGLNEVFYAPGDEFDLLIGRLKGMRFINPGKVDIIHASRLIQRR